MAAVRVTLIVPELIIVPCVRALLMTTPAFGLKTALAFTVKIVTTLKFTLAVTSALVLEMVRFRNEEVLVPPMACDVVPLKVTVPAAGVNVPLFVKFPVRERFALLELAIVSPVPMVTEPETVRLLVVSVKVEALLVAKVRLLPVAVTSTVG